MKERKTRETELDATLHWSLQHSVGSIVQLDTIIFCYLAKKLVFPEAHFNACSYIE